MFVVRPRKASQAPSQSKRRRAVRPLPELLEDRVVMATGPYYLQAELASASPRPVDWFGSDVALSSDGGLLVVSVTGSDGPGSSGKVETYARTGLQWERTSVLPAPGENIVFSTALALSGDGGTLAVAMYRSDAGSSASVRIYEREGGGWTNTEELTVPYGGFLPEIALSADGDVLAVGAPQGRSDDPAHQGFVRIYTATAGDWGLTAELVAPGDPTSDQFGLSVALSGDGKTLVAGAVPPAPGQPSRPGVAYVFEDGATGWGLTSQIASPSSFGFGTNAALSRDGEHLLVQGFDADADPQFYHGVVYAYGRDGSGWTLEDRFVGEPRDEVFGRSLALDVDGSTAVVGSTGVGGGRGAAFVYGRAGSAWSLDQTLTDAEGAPGDLFGWATAIGGPTIVVGSPGSPTGMTGGTASVYYAPDGFAVLIDPVDRTGHPRTMVTFTAEAVGAESISTQWQTSGDGGQTWADVPRATSPWLSFIPTLADSGRLYRAVFTDGGGATVVTRAATLTVVEATPVVTITSSPNPARFHEETTFHVRLTSDGSTPLVPEGSFITFAIGGYQTAVYVTDGEAVVRVPANTLKPGVYVATAFYIGEYDPVFATASGTATQVILRAATTITAHVTADPYVMKPVSVYGLISQVGAGLPSETRPTGFVNFEGSGYFLGAGAVDEPAYPTPGEPASGGFQHQFILVDGNLAIVAFYSGDEWNEPSVSEPLLVNVAPAPTITSAYRETYSLYAPYGVSVPIKVQTLTTDYAPAADGTIRARVDGGEPFDVSLRDTVAYVHFPNLSAGGHVATFEYFDSNGRFLSSTASIGIAVYKAWTEVSLVSYGAVSNRGEEVVFTAVVTNPAAQNFANAGVVRFYVGERLAATVPVGDFGRAHWIATGLEPGVYGITAVYEESDNYQAGQSALLVHQVDPLPVVLKPATITTLATIDPATAEGETASFVATVAGADGRTGPTSGLVAFSFGGRLAAYIPVGADGRATLTTTALVAGTYEVTAAFLESDLFQGSPSNAVRQEVSPGAVTPASTVTTLTSGANPAPAGAAIALIATVTAADGGPAPTSGVVRFYVGLDAVREVALDGSGRAVLDASSLIPGSYRITAVYLGSEGRRASQSEPFIQVVAPAASSGSGGTTAGEPGGHVAPGPAPTRRERALAQTRARREAAAAARAERLAKLAQRRPPAARARMR